MAQTAYEAPFELMNFVLRQAADGTGALRSSRISLRDVSGARRGRPCEGVSLLLVPKRIRSKAGTLRNNDIQAVSVEHKMGIRASPTCVMALGERDGGLTC